MQIREISSPDTWDAFIAARQFRPFLQSWRMGEVYRDIGQEPVRFTVEQDGKTIAACFGHIVRAKRGAHIAVPYGPIVDETLGEEVSTNVIRMILEHLKSLAKTHNCRFVRLSPFWSNESHQLILREAKGIASPLHLLAEHVWYLPLTQNDPWKNAPVESTERVNEEVILMNMRKTTRNLVRRAERDGVTIEKSASPLTDLEHFIRLHDETRKRHGFTAYTNTFFRSQVKRFSEQSECTVYLARFQGDVIAASVHMHAFGETSYHHGASSSAHHKIPASYLLQWTAIRDAIKRGDRIYNFWGIAPVDREGNVSKKHPFAGVTLFKTGFGGSVLNLTHCIDLPVTSSYWLTYAFEVLRKWKRGF